MIKPLNNYDEIIKTSALTLSDEKRLNPLPSNIVLNKVLTGWGATWSEIKAVRNSIIVLPHKSQIFSKHKRHSEEDNTFVVVEGVTAKAIEKHLKSNGTKKLKFLTTPEGLKKLISAILNTGVDPYLNYFILLDECHKITTDVGYRVNISQVMDDFFLFESKAMISATPLRPSDPRFNSFEFWKVEHERDVKKDITVFTVNNLASAFKEYIESYKGDQLFIFFNSLNGIHALMESNGLTGLSSIYCSTDGVKDFEIKGYTNAFSEIDNSTLSKFNFLTSSFFNGLDIDKLESLPDILILTDTRYVSHSIIDPNTDTYQILGRFRQPIVNGEYQPSYNTACHIINNRFNTSFKLEEQAISDILKSESRYELLLELQAATSDPFLQDEVYGEALKRQKPYVNILQNDGSIDYFKFDNYLYEEKVKMCYGHEISSGLAYYFSELFNVSERSKVYVPEEFETMSKEMKRYSADGIKWACNQFILNENLQGVEGADKYFFELTQRFPFVRKAMVMIGYDKMEDLKFSYRAIQKELLKLDQSERRVHQGMIDAVYATFILNISYELPVIKNKLQALFDEFNVIGKAKSTDIRTYYEVKTYCGHKPLLKKELKQLKENDKPLEIDRIKMKTVKMCKLLNKKHNSINPYSTRTHKFN